MSDTKPPSRWIEGSIDAETGKFRLEWSRRTRLPARGVESGDKPWRNLVFFGGALWVVVSAFGVLAGH